MDDSHGAQHARHPTFRQYVMVATFLFVITIIEFILIYGRVGIADDLGAAKVPLLVVLSGIKFAIVIMFYMHLKFDSRLFTAVFLAGLALAFAVGLGLLGLFVALQGEPREFASAHATPYVEGGEGEAIGGGGEPREAAQPAPVPTAAPQVKESTAKAQAEPKQETAAPVQVGTAPTLAISVVGDALKFDTAKFSARAGSEVTLKFNNVSTINYHNWVLVQPGTKDAVATAGQTAASSGWVPPGDARVIAKTRLLDPGANDEVRFTAPAAGAYQYVCTFPGHNFTMFGDFVVTQ